MKRSSSALAVFAVIVGALQFASPALGSTGGTAPGESSEIPIDAPAFDPSVPEPGPGDLTWAQASELEQAATGKFTAPEPSRKSLLGTSGASLFQGSGGASCSINTGNVYLRASGGIYPYGAVGGKPYTQCTVIMAKIEQTTDLYKTVWWGLQKVAGPFYSVNFGEGRLTQTSVIRRCDDLRETTFRMIVRSTGTFPTGVRGTASAFEDGKWPCGTV